MQTYPYLDAAGGSSQNISATAATHPPASDLVNCTSDGTSCGTTGTYFRQIGYTSHMVTEPSSRNSLTRNDCNNSTEFFNTYFGVLAVPQWEAVFTLTVLTFFILLTIIGNTLVILSVFTYKPLRIVQNFFIVSLAVADLTVALLVMPLKVAYSIQGRWEFGIHVCKMWLTSDVMCCTSSILNLSTIALDRYWAITDPINYAQKRTVGRVLLLIAGVWVLSLVISSPPLVGWNDWPKHFTNATPCELTSNRGYVIYSALGSFFIPLILMTIVYIEIYAATKRRLRERAQASKMCALVTQLSDAEVPLPAGIGSCCSAYFCCGKDANRVQKTILQDRDSLSSETNVDAKSALPYYGAEQRVVVLTQKKTRQAKIKDSIKQVKQHGARASKRMCPPATHAVAHAAPERDLHTTKNSREEKAEIVLKANPPDSEPKDLPVEPKADSSNPDIPSKSEPPQEYTRAIDNKATQVQQKPSIMYTFIEEKQKISLSKERRAARTLGIIMGVFVICWLPFFLMYVILPFCDTCCPTNKLKNFITWLGYFNSGLNPVIYTVFNIEYRRAFKRLLRLG